MSKQTIDLPNISSLQACAQQLAARIPPRSWVFLQGDLGSGKTTFSQHFIAQKGCDERVASPTYALMQDYDTDSGTVIHCDLYRLGDPEELYEIGLLELADARDAIVLVEWAEKGYGVLPAPDVTLALAITDPKTQNRQLTITEHN